MVLIIAALDSAGMVDNWIVGRADLRLRFSSGIRCPLPINCGCVCDAFGPGLMVMMAMAMVMMTIVMVLVMVIIVPEALR